MNDKPKKNWKKELEGIYRSAVINKGMSFELKRSILNDLSNKKTAVSDKYNNINDYNFEPGDN